MDNSIYNHTPTQKKNHINGIKSLINSPRKSDVKKTKRRQYINHILIFNPLFITSTSLLNSDLKQASTADTPCMGSGDHKLNGTVSISSAQLELR